MKQNRKKVGIILAVSAMLFLLEAGTAFADSENVTVTWIVPEDTSITISFPNGETKIIFEPGAQNFTDCNAKSQTSTLAALNVTNAGNNAVSIKMNLTGDFPTNITFLNVSVGDAVNTTRYYWANTNETSQITVSASIVAGSWQNYWFWSCGTRVPKTSAAGVNATLFVESTGV